MTEGGFTCSGSKPTICNPTGPFCGDYAVNRANEQCDKGPNGGAGCQATCLPEVGYTCTNNVCTKLPAGNKGMSMVGNPYINYNNVFVTIVTDKAFQFANENEMKSFMKYTFPDPSTIPNSVFCSQKVNNLKTFECLLVYASGIPNRSYTVNFSFDYKGDTGFLAANINPLNNTFQTRSLR